jgi:hypothetical protein
VLQVADSPAMVLEYRARLNHMVSAQEVSCPVYALIGT